MEPKEGSPSIEKVRSAQKAVGEALWLTTRARPDIVYVVSRMGPLPLRALQKLWCWLSLNSMAIWPPLLLKDWNLTWKKMNFLCWPSIRMPPLPPTLRSPMAHSSSFWDHLIIFNLLEVRQTGVCNSVYNRSRTHWNHWRHDRWGKHPCDLSRTFPWSPKSRQNRQHACPCHTHRWWRKLARSPFEAESGLCKASGSCSWVGDSTCTWWINGGWHWNEAIDRCAFELPQESHGHGKVLRPKWKSSRTWRERKRIRKKKRRTTGWSGTVEKACANSASAAAHHLGYNSFCSGRRRKSWRGWTLLFRDYRDLYTSGYFSYSGGTAPSGCCSTGSRSRHTSSTWKSRRGCRGGKWAIPKRSPWTFGGRKFHCHGRRRSRTCRSTTSSTRCSEIK